MAIDQHSFEKCFRDSFEPLTRYAYLYIRDNEQSKEIVQGSFLKIWEKRKSITITTDLKVYLYQIVKNDVLNYLRKSRKFEFTADIPDRCDEENSNRYISPEKLHEQVSNLPSRCREILVLKKIHGLTYKQIGLRLNISEKSVENQIGIALKRLRAALTQSLNDLTDNAYE